MQGLLWAPTDVSLGCRLPPGHPMCSPQVWDPNFTPRGGARKCPVGRGGRCEARALPSSPREDSGGGSPRRSQAPSPGAQGPSRPSPPLRLVPQTEGRVQGGASGAGRSCLRMQIPGPLTDSGLPLHRPPLAPPLQRLLLQANPPSRSQTPSLGQERGHWELPRSQSTLQTPPAVTGPCACAAVSERSLLRRGLSQGPALGQAWCRDVRPGEHLLGSLGRCRRAQTPGREGRGQTKGVGRKRGCRQSDLTGVGSKSPPGRVVVGGQAQACHFFS